MLRPCLLATLLLSVSPLQAQGGGACSPTNFINFCVNEDTDGDDSTSSEYKDALGSSLAFGDFDGDGFKDLAVGVPGDRANAGAVHIFPGSRSNIRIRSRVIYQGDIPGQISRIDERFGQSLSSGDFNNDGIDDLAVGAPSENSGLYACNPVEIACRDDGVVHVFFGTAALGLATQGALTFNAWDAGLFPRTHIAHGLAFGQALGAGDLDGDGFDDLIIGAPNTREGVFGHYGRGLVVVLRGGRSGFLLEERSASLLEVPRGGHVLQQNNLGTGPMLVTQIAGAASLVVGHPNHDDQGLENVGVSWIYQLDATVLNPFRFELQALLRQTSFGLAGQSDFDEFGSAVAVGDFNADGFSDLALGAPGRDIPRPNFGSIEDAGRIFIAYGSAAGLDLGNIQVLDQSFFPSQDVERHDRFGAALASGDISGDGIDDLIIGAPGEGRDNVGFVYFLVGSAQRLQVATSGSPIFSGGYTFSQAAIGGSNEKDDHFGQVLAVADVTGDGQAEIAIGVPDREVNGKRNAGQVYVTRRLQLGAQ